MEVTSMICTDTYIVYHLGYPLFLSLVDLKAEVNYFDDLNQNRHFFLLNRLRHIWIPMNQICDRLNHLSTCYLLTHVTRAVDFHCIDNRTV